MAPLIQVFDMPASLRFYRDVIGFEINMSSGEGDDVDWVLLKLNDIELMLNTAYEKQYRPIEKDEKRVKSHADLTLYFGYPDIDTLYTYFKNKGLELKEPVITGYGWKALYLYDPDNYQLCFHYPIQNA
jgi:catechol 2,3-dioxygenase-like lactoylglutathione lyase family enzyme